MQLQVAGTTHVGLKRGHNEDGFLLLPEQRVFCVADGMGGHAAGEVASALALETVAGFFTGPCAADEGAWPIKPDVTRSPAENRLAAGIQLANRKIFEANQQGTGAERARDMGTTIASLFFEGQEAVVGHVGDSRVYRFRRGELAQVTEDHSLLNDYLKSGRLRPEDAEAFPYKNVILRALGIRDEVAVDVSRLAPEAGDLFLLCSDGLSGMVADAEMQEILRAVNDLEQASQRLIDSANAAGGADNVTCVLVRVAGV